MNFKIIASTSKGRSHSTNEDSYAIGKNYLVIADGMGGAVAGKKASEIVVKTIANCLDKVQQSFVSESQINKALISSIEKAGTEINRYVKGHPETDGMGSTVLIIVMHNNVAYIAWCGDSRCYVNNSNKTESLTKDHSYVQMLIDNNLITEDEAFFHPENNVITRCVGGPGDDIAQPDYITYSLQPGDVLIACSDGLSGYCRNHDIHKTISRCRNLKALPKRLTELAYTCGADDDITIAVVADYSRNRPFASTWTALSQWLHKR